VLLERDNELSAMNRFLDDVRGGEGGMLVLEGPPGIGKTALLDAIDDCAGRGGIEVMHARASQLDCGFSFGVASQLFERLVRDAGAEERGVLLRGVARDAMSALGISGDRAEGDRPGAAGAEHRRCPLGGSLLVAMAALHGTPVAIFATGDRDRYASDRARS
jgi:predicted ATPase